MFKSLALKKKFSFAKKLGNHSEHYIITVFSEILNDICQSENMHSTFQAST